MKRAGAMLAATALFAGAASAQPVSTPIARTETTVTGQPLRPPPAPFALTVTRVDLPAGGTIPTHKHPWPRYVYVEAGAIRVTNHDAGTVNDFTAGQVIVEAVDQWHEGRVTGDAPARLIVFDQAPPGAVNSVPRTAPAR